MSAGARAAFRGLRGAAIAIWIVKTAKINTPTMLKTLFGISVSFWTALDRER
jgi:hypothetical protein